MEKVKNVVVQMLNRAASKYIRRNNIKVIAVAGSIGKTSTVNAIRTVLGQKYKVHQPKTSYNTNKSVHLEMFDMNFAISVAGWMVATCQILFRSLGKAQYEVLVIEIGTDYPGELQSFAWLQPDIGVLTAIAPEHMKRFKTIEAVALEELVVANFSKYLVFNRNTVDPKYISPEVAGSKQLVWYGASTNNEARNYRLEGNRARADFHFDGHSATAVELQVLGIHSLDALTAAGSVAVQCGLSLEDIVAGLQAVEPVKGRMQRLTGKRDSIIIDDSYNASPDAAKAALDVLYSFDSPQRIAVLGMMNEMGEYSGRAHTEVGQYCDPAKLDQVITIGTDANTFLATAAKKRGCEVRSFDSPYEAGRYLDAMLKPGAILLVKGSQNGVFAEEAIKPLLADSSDEAKLVRQSSYWMDIKGSQFPTA